MGQSSGADGPVTGTIHGIGGPRLDWRTKADFPGARTSFRASVRIADVHWEFSWPYDAENALLGECQ
jgi:hypothetical protein